MQAIVVVHMTMFRMLEFENDIKYVKKRIIVTKSNYYYLSLHK